MDKKTNNITVGESILKAVVPEKKKELHGDKRVFYTAVEGVPFGYNKAIDETLSTPLPDVNDCVEIDVQEISEIIYQLDDTFENPIFCNNEAFEIAKAIANSKSILKWNKI